MSTTLVRIEAPSFVGGLLVNEGIVTQTAPILKRYRGWSMENAVENARSLGWSVVITEGTPKAAPKD